MSTMRHFLIILACAFLFGSPAEAQSIQQETRQAPAVSQSLTVVIEKQKLRFSALASAQEVRLEIFNQAGEVIYDSGFVSGPELSWALRDANGGDIPSGLYVYTLTIKETGSATPATQRGHVILERGRDQLWVTNNGAIGAESLMSGGELTVTSDNETSVAGARIGRAGASRSTLNLDFFGTPGLIPMFTGSEFLADSVISQDFNGRIGIGTQRPGAALLTVAGQIETTSGGIKFPNGSVQTSAGISQVLHNTTLTGNGTEGSPLGVNLSGLNFLSSVAHDTTLTGNGTIASQLGIANGGVTGPKIASGQVVKSLNGLFDNVNLTAGQNITITPSGNGLSISATNSSGSVTHDNTLTGSGAGGSPLGVAIPLSLNGSISNSPILGAFNNDVTGIGINAIGGTGVRADGLASNSGVGGFGIITFGGASNSNFGGRALSAEGGASDSNFGGQGVSTIGGASNSGIGGTGLLTTGGRSNSNNGGLGLFAAGGDSISGRGGNGISVDAGSGVTDGFAATFFGFVSVNGNMQVVGALSKSAGSFKIDHPLDPANKYLSHSFVESPDMMNVYNGNITTDANGEATVTLPDYFEALNRDFRYQLTVIGQFAQAIVASKVSGNRFTIKTDQPGVEVSWQVTGIRQDAYANKHRIPIEEEKTERERGYYLRPQDFGQPEEKSLEWARNPELMLQIKSRRQEAETRRREKKNDR
ncbi:MAG TPA: hypothetical protein VJ810_19080 [Blastocatellia bacterium]|nr:hypothetical protein [Blastocatellia bacterium]